MRVLPFLAVMLAATPAPAQQRPLARDSTLDNLTHPAGQRTAPWGSLGRILKVGAGPRAMILVPGLGFGGGVFDEFMERRKSAYTMYAVTLPGFGGTDPLPMPPPGESYAARPWTNSALRAIIGLMDKERIPRATLVAHWALGSQIALRLALEQPKRFDAVVLIAGVAKAYYAGTPEMLTWSASQRAAFADGVGSRWFKTVTRLTWDDNNFMSYDYALHPLRGLFLWREAASPTLPVWIRYLLEFYASDVTPGLPALKVPTLVVRPGFDDPGFYIEPGRNYMRNLRLDSWRGVPEAVPMLEFVTIPASRLFVMYDKPEDLETAVGRWLSGRR
jgi:pimeloyl-ACP methyl ester carboxylesterase